MSKVKGYRFGITMRETMAPNYFEPRDTIAQDWSKYMGTAFPNSQYLFVPNSGQRAVDFVKKWDLNILILSGGDNLGISKNRDHTEQILLQYALENNIPVIGVCRGLQLIHTFFGGSIKKGDEKFVSQHRATKHTIEIEGQSFNVNSYHENILVKETVHAKLKVFATCSTDQSVEGLHNENILAMMWHPERDEKMSEWNRELIVNFLEKNRHV